MDGSKLKDPEERAREVEAERGTTVWRCCQSPLLEWLQRHHDLREEAGRAGRAKVPYSMIRADARAAGFDISESALSKHFLHHIPDGADG